MSDAVYVWYFAYGSNMQSDTFRGRRGIEWRQAVPVRAPGWRLALDKPSLMSGGTSYANIVPDATAEVIGVAYEITMAELEHVELTEGVAIGNYVRAMIAVAPLAPDHAAAGTITECFTLTTTASDPNRRPSTRYLGLLIAGAEEHGLPAEYVDWLRGLPAQEETDAERALRGQLDEALRGLRERKEQRKKEPR